MENKVVKREFSYSDDFTNKVIVCAIKNLEKSSDIFCHNDLIIFF